MKILVTLMFAFMIAGGATFAQDDTGKAGELIDGAKIEFVETVHDFGANPQGTPVTTDFVFKNSGNAPLVLQSVKASCGCTTPNWPREPILPGQESAIKVKYNMARAGNFTKTVTVTVKPAADDITPEVIKLTIKGSAKEKAPEKTVDELKPTIITNPNIGAD
ncbi:MAG: DUF1573 domain-containing protein [Bacteroidetes bacterium]|nr:DUF1573 domain-containing protein [Bacteroidota bacterium]